MLFELCCLLCDNSKPFLLPLLKVLDEFFFCLSATFQFVQRSVLANIPLSEIAERIFCLRK
jgi:hypothetical protein